MEISEMNEEQILEAAERQGFNPDGEKDAKTFLEDGEKILGISVERGKKTNEKLSETHQELIEIRKELAENKKVTAEFKDLYSTVEQRIEERFHRQYQEDMAKLKEEQLEAVSEADTKKYEEIDRKMMNRSREMSEQRVPEKPPKSPYYDQWEKANPWYNDDVGMTVFANSAGEVIRTRDKLISDTDFYSEISKAVTKQFPEKFKKQTKTSTVEDGGLPETKTGKKGYDDLPSDAKAACDDFIKQGLMETPADYLKHYVWE